MRLLILGGTVFLGRHIVAAALERGHEVTIFHRASTTQGYSPRLSRYTATAAGTWRRSAGAAGTA